MPRLRRWNVQGDVYHLISRFVDREWFIQHEEERAAYMRLLGIALAKSDWTCLAYVVMSNHVHLVVEAGNEPLGRWVRRVHSPFAQWMNDRHRRIGNIFCRGPRDLHIPRSNIARTIAYVHNNPVRAGLVATARDSPWSSHRAYCRLSAPQRWLHVARGFQLSGISTPKSFDAFTSTSMSQPCDADLRLIRRALLPRGPLEMATPTDDETRTVPLLARPWTVVRPDPRTLVACVAEITGISVSELCSRRRLPAIVAARRVAIDAALRLGLTGADIAAAVGITQQAASKLARASRTEGQAAMVERVVDRVFEEVVQVVSDPTCQLTG